MFPRNEVPSSPRIQAQNCRYTASAAVIAADDGLDANSPSPLHRYEVLGPESSALSA
jgi:hypothetical protein